MLSRTPIALLVFAATASFLTMTGAPARAVVVGTLVVGPTSGMDESLFSGSIAEARCPEGTADSYFSIDGPDLPRDQAILAPGNTTGTGPQSFQGASIANIKSTSSGSFAHSGTYTIRFNCVRSPDGVVTNTYERAMTYKAGGRGSFTLQAAPHFSPPPSPPAGSAASPTPVATAAPSPRPGGPAGPSSSASGTVGEARQDPIAGGDGQLDANSGMWVAFGVAFAAAGAAVAVLVRRRRRAS